MPTYLLHEYGKIGRIAVKTLQYLMGHADIATTLNVYTHLKLEDAKDELEQMKVREQLKRRWHWWIWRMPREN